MWHLQKVHKHYGTWYIHCMRPRWICPCNLWWEHSCVLIIFWRHPTKKALTLLITLLQKVRRLGGIVKGSEVAPRRRHIPCSPNCSTKRARKPSNSPKTYSRDGKSERGRHLQKRIRSPSPSSLPSSNDSKESNACTKSSTKVHPKCKWKETYCAWRWERKLEKFK